MVETINRERKVVDKQPETASRGYSGRGTKSSEVSIELAALLSKQPPAKWSSFSNDTCGKIKLW